MSTSTFADAGVAQFVARATLTDLDVTTLRSGAATRARNRTPGPELADVRDVVIGRCPARVYRPVRALTGPVLLWLHGGGWSFGGPDTHDRMSRRLAAAAGVTVVTLDYRLAPEHRWPAAIDDTVDALRWLAGSPSELGFTPTRIAVGGDSAGGNLAALACLRLRDQGDAAQPDLQVLVYANTDLTGKQPSMTEKASGFGLDADTIRHFNRHWVPDEAQWGDPRVSPLKAENLSGLPAAIVVTAEHDPLRDEGEAYAERLRGAGVAVLARREPGLVHNFLLLDELSPACASAADQLAADVDRLMRPAHRVVRPGEAAYDQSRLGFQTFRPHRPAAIVLARRAGDIVDAVQLARSEGRRIAVQATGHGVGVVDPEVLLVNTSAMRAVTVDPVARTARVAAGAR